MPVIYLDVGTTSWLATVDFNPDNNTIELWGGGGNGQSAITAGGGAIDFLKGGGGGGYVKSTNFPINPGDTATVQIGTGGAPYTGTNTGTTSFTLDATYNMSATGGRSAQPDGALGGQGGVGTGNGGTILAYSGGNGYPASPSVSHGGMGGGAAGGPLGDGGRGGRGTNIVSPGGGGGGGADGGTNGSNSSGASGGSGGTGANGGGNGGGGGDAPNSNGTDGSIGQEYSSVRGSGGGGGGGGAQFTPPITPGNGGAGGLYGGGGGASGTVGGGGPAAGGLGAPGMIRITYTAGVTPPPDPPVPVSNQSTQFLICTPDWTLTQPVSKVYGLEHLAGLTVTGLIDGIVLEPTTVNLDGSVDLPFPASFITIGLGFTAQVQTPYLDTDNPTVQGRRKNIVAVTARVDSSAMPQVGSNQPDGGAQVPPSIAPEWENMEDSVTQNPGLEPGTYVGPSGQTTTKLFSGDFRANIIAEWNEKGQTAVQQTQPLPLNLTAVMPEVLEGDLPEQTYSDKKGSGGQQQPSESRGPGPWMLRR